MNRDEILNDILSHKENNICLELSTGVGKTKMAIEILRARNCRNVLIVIPRLVLINNWKEELKKWDYDISPIFTTYVSIHKHTGEYDAIIFDEAHHLTERCYDVLPDIKAGNNIFLSATLTREKRHNISWNFPETFFYKVGLKEAIDNEILPDPVVYLIPLELDKNKHNYSFMVNSNKGKTIECNYEDRWNYIKNKTYRIKVKCTEWQYNKELSNKIDYYKRLYMRGRNEAIKNKWLKLCGDRLKFLSSIKTDIVAGILKKYKNDRTIVFCNSILQTEVLGKYCINSENKKSREYLDMFNTKRIKHITCVNMLNEGVNLTDCKVGIFAVLNSSEIMVKQKNGRLLRHKEPLIIIPYYKDTREQEIVEKMLEDYNPELTKIITLNELENEK